MSHDKPVSKCKSDKCQEYAIKLSGYCWNHLPDREEYVAKLIMAMNNETDLTGANLTKVVLKKSHIEKAQLKKANLSQADLSGSHLFDCRLDGAELLGANLSDSDLTHCVLRGSDLTKANISKSRLWNTDMSGANLSECDLSFSDLWNTKLFNIKLWHAVLSGAKSITMESFAYDTAVGRKYQINELGAAAAEESYRDLKQYFLSNGRYNDGSWASFKEMSMTRKLLKKNRDIRYIPSMLMNLLCGYGEKPYRIVLSSVATVLAFAGIYCIFGTIEYSIDTSYHPAFADYLYYSVITFTTVGYGDFIPKAASAFRFLAAAEAFSGVFLTGLFVFTLARKYSAR